MAGMMWLLWISVAVLIASGFIALAACGLYRGGLASKRRAVRLVLLHVCMVFGVTSILAAGAAGYLGVCRWGPPPTEKREAWPNGVVYERHVLTDTNLVAIHLVRIDTVSHPVAFDTAPAVKHPQNLRTQAQTLTDHMQTHNSDVAINASFFRPFRDNTPWDYRPKAGDLVQPIGTTRSGQQNFGHPEPDWVAVNLWNPGRFSFGVADTSADVIVSGNTWLLQHGEIPADLDASGSYPRTAVGRDQAGRLVLVVVDGKQPGYSLGVTYKKLAEFMVDQGVTDAVNLDGGGSTTLGRRDTSGEPQVVNRPIHTQIPRRQRPIANVLSVRFVEANDSATSP